MQLNAARYPSMGATGKTIVAEEGVPALWKGCVVLYVDVCLYMARSIAGLGWWWCGGCG